MCVGSDVLDGCIGPTSGTWILYCVHVQGHYCIFQLSLFASCRLGYAMHTSTHTGWLSHRLQNNVRVMWLSFWACAVTVHGTQRILEVLCKCEQSANTRKFFGRREREYAEDTYLPHSRKTTVVHKLCDTSSIKTEVCELAFSWSEWWKSRPYTVSPQRWNVVSARCNIVFLILNY